MAVIGTAAPIAAIVEILGKSISLLRELRQYYTDADFRVLNLVGQVTALRAVRIKVKEWAGNDLDDSVTCCRIFVETIHAELAELTQKEDGTLGFASRIKFVVWWQKVFRLRISPARPTPHLITRIPAKG